ncbi:unnamed protein product [Porites lobata]|uniref:Uncharacterized protein n=1 Tax=Porites lobata TaxID=104759 RepID=A0ABN8RGL4_9CNID|nr:unnamed protein product [Porites lobata]
MAKVEQEIKCKHLLYWSGKHGIELSNSWDMSADGQKKLENTPLPKPQKLDKWEIHNHRQGTLSLEEFIAKLRIRAKEAYYTIQHNDPFMRDFPVLGMNSDLLRKDCFKVGNAFTFKEVRDMAKSEESADNQLQLINTPSILDQ